MQFAKCLASLSVLSFVAACSSHGGVIKSGSAADRTSHEIEVVEDTMVLEVQADGNMAGIPSYDMRRIEYFIADYKARGRRHGPLVLSLPLGSPFAGQFESGAQQAMDLAYEYGVSDVSRSDYDSNGSPEAPMVLAFTAYRAIPPNCPSLATISLSRSPTNDPQPAFGCATQANLAAMIADPADLLGTRRADPADTLRRAEVLTKYRAGESTATERTESEQGAVSTAVE